jgi:PTS system mannose-specific IID component
VIRRYFFLQGCWNFEGMQNVGFAFALLPALREQYRDRPDELRKAVKRHLEFFNTQPGLAGVILGAALRMEQDVAEGKGDPRAIGAFKVGTMGSLGAVGDTYFWGAVKPFSSVLGALLALLHPLVGIAAILAGFNAPNLAVRKRGFDAGMEGQEGAMRFLKDAAFQLRAEERKLLASVLGGVYGGAAVALYGRHSLSLGGGGFWLLLPASMALVHAVALLYRKAVTPAELLFFLGMVSLLLYWR